MPATSVQQWKMMSSICGGSLKHPTISKAEACEYIKSQPSPEGLPHQVKGAADGEFVGGSDDWFAIGFNRENTDATP